MGTVSLTSEQVKKLDVKPGSRLSPHLEQCCLRLSALLSYEKAAAEVAVQTGRRVSAKTQQRLVHRQSFAGIEVPTTVNQMSLDGGMIRIRTPKGSPCEWKEYKALNLIEHQQGMAWFKSNDALLETANGLPLASLVRCLGDGHDGVWSLYEHIGRETQRCEILDWFHLMENLHKIPVSREELSHIKSLLWQGKVEEVIEVLDPVLDTKPVDEIRRFRGYLERHRSRIPNYRTDQARSLSIGSGDVESRVKQINQRTKLPGASWSIENVPQVLAHRCAYLNGHLDPPSIILSRK